MENSVSVGLLHLCVGVETRIAKFSDLLGEELDTVGGVAEDDRLVDLELRIVRPNSSCQKSGAYLREEGVEAMDFLRFFNIGIILSDTFKSKFVHEVDFVWLNHVLVLKLVSGNGK